MFREGNHRIYFGEVHSVKDEEKLYRIQVKVSGITDVEPINLDDLPWYYPWYGTRNLPEIGDVVPVLIFDDNFVTGFYGDVLAKGDSEEGTLHKSTFEGKDYDNLFVSFKRLIEGKPVTTQYYPSQGVTTINDKTLIQSLDEVINLRVGIEVKNFLDKEKVEELKTDDANTIQITKEKIYLGKEGVEEHPVLLGDLTRQEITDFENFVKESLDKIYDMFNTIQTAAGSSPYTMPIQAQMMPKLPTLKTKFAEVDSKLLSNGKYKEKILSEKTFLEK